MDLSVNNDSTLTRLRLTPEIPVSIVHYMVNYQERRLDRTFAALPVVIRKKRR
jgi:hypothetical protein